MQLRRFVAENTPSALGAVRHAFGSDAIILANRKLGDQVEIIATSQIDEGILASASEIENWAGSDEGTITQPNKIRDTGIAGAKKGGASSNDETNDSENNNPEIALNITHLSALDKDPKTDVIESVNREDSTPGNAPALTLPPTVESLVDSVSETNDIEPYLNRVIERIDNRFRSIEINLWGSQQPYRRELLGRLLRMGLGAELAVRIAERIAPDLLPDDAMKVALELLTDTIPVGSVKHLYQPGVTAITGHPGSGKSTVIMKIATEYVLKNCSNSIVIICADPRRIGAYESMQVFGKNLGIPVVQSHSAEELESLILAFSHKSLVLVEHAPGEKISSAEVSNVSQLPLTDAISNKDITSPSTMNEKMVVPKTPSNENVKASDSLRPNRQVAVLSVTSQAAHLESLMNLAPENAFDLCVLTYLDECTRVGELFSVLSRHQIKTLGYSDSPSLQRPIQQADASYLVAAGIAASMNQKNTDDVEMLLDLIQPTGLTDRYLPMPEFKPESGVVS